MVVARGWKWAEVGGRAQTLSSKKQREGPNLQHSVYSYSQSVVYREVAESRSLCPHDTHTHTVNYMKR